MDLAQYKKAWENQPEEKNRVSALEIYKITQMKSTSIVKWIFIIGLLEFVFWIVISFLFSKLGNMEIYENLNLMGFFNFSYYLNFGVVILFLFLFYKNYTSVSAIEDTKTLIRKIIRVRKTVKFYVYYNIIINVLVLIIASIWIINTPEALETLIAGRNLTVDRSQFITTYIITQALVLIVICAFLLLFYYLLYGILLKKLNKNYKELIKLEDSN